MSNGRIAEEIVDDNPAGTHHDPGSDRRSFRSGEKCHPEKEKVGSHGT